jgi:hypothetical protein
VPDNSFEAAALTLAPEAKRQRKEPHPPGLKRTVSSAQAKPKHQWPFRQLPSLNSKNGHRVRIPERNSRRVVGATLEGMAPKLRAISR